MSKHNYSQYSKNNFAAENETVTEEVDVVIAPVVDVEPQVEETPATPDVVVETVPEPKTFEGTVVGCTKLNVRTYPSVNSEVVCVINANEVVIIDPEKSNKDWFKVITSNGSVGFCMRKYVNANL